MLANAYKYPGILAKPECKQLSFCAVLSCDVVSEYLLNCLILTQNDACDHVTVITGEILSSRGTDLKVRCNDHGNKVACSGCSSRRRRKVQWFGWLCRCLLLMHVMQYENQFGQRFVEECFGKRG